ncbi:hypothetical protein KUV50_14710 [Membranicola marinus]|uniref:Glycoside hydrolase family 2 immunoglobulin-like beta-sandwich domain-containing protein n=1 Tax=Membranihabitans marinus TaxID=1227546 RepID=A0A953LDZ1_9BACT|nr:hypothetical protein [Membranihabitans marinus]MBY5959399.1 hypothetical protein [Membranihabitans marinus]
MRQFTKDPTANGETDFKGETEWLDTDGRIHFLNQYADFASKFFENPDLDQAIVTDGEIDSLLSALKPQPSPRVRETLLLKDWKSYGYRRGQHEESKTALREWKSYKGVTIEEEALVLENGKIEKTIDLMDWRFKLESRIRLSSGSTVFWSLKKGKENVIEVEIGENKIRTQSTLGMKESTLDLNQWVDLLIEADLQEKKFNVRINGVLVFDFIPMANQKIDIVDEIIIEGHGKVVVDDLLLMNYAQNDNVRIPFIPEVRIDENFELKKPPQNWTDIDFDDGDWKEVKLPAVHGGLREAGEALYLRKKLKLGGFERGTLEIESLDPGGEVWINGEVVTVVDTRHPRVIDVTRYLRKNDQNIIAVKVRPYRSNIPMTHSPADRNIGWFLDETKLVLSSQCMIQDVEVYTKELGGVALQSNTIRIQYPRSEYFSGNVQVNYYPWFPDEGDTVATVTIPVEVRPRIVNTIEVDLPITDPLLWAPGNPHLYKVEVLLRDNEDQVIDDKVITTGIRTIDQSGGYLYVNQKVEMLNGVQIMGFRTPVEKLAKYNRCPPDEIVAEEMLMVQKMDANLLRIHVHAEKDTADGVNDIRYARLADQMGIYLIWSTAGFIREGEAWNVDIEGYPAYMARVFNHPSIVMWEASNHPNRFKNHDISDSHDYIRDIYNTIYDRDPSRLISPTSFWQHTHYGNYRGDLDYEGNPMVPVPEYHASRMTRGSQDAYTGYGAEWTKLRTAPNEWAASCLNAGEKAYFNFEHEESAGQPNWELSKGKPWYKIQSYEWSYEKGSIGRKLNADEWRASQAWQAFSAWESMKKQMLLGYDGFSWCSLRGGANTGTYQKPLIDNLRHPKLAYYTNKMAFQRTWAGSANVDVIYGPDDAIEPVIHHLGEQLVVNLRVTLVNAENIELDAKEYHDVQLKRGRDIVKLPGFQFDALPGKYGFIVYEIFGEE